MSRSTPATAFARLTPTAARAVLVAVFGLTVLCLGITLSPVASTRVGKEGGGEGDIALYRAQIERIRAGEGYYQAAAAELIGRGYPTQNVFNWRTPLPMWMLGKLSGDSVGRGLLGLMALAVMLLAFEGLAREQGHGLGRPLGCALLLSGPLMPCILGDLFVSPMLWAGVLVALSIVAFGLHRYRTGAVLGVAAVFFRELALPYAVLAAVLALWRRRWDEAAVWLVGLVGWAIFFGYHWSVVSGLIPADARAHHEGWVQFGGLAFVLSTVQMNAYLLLLPQWVTALYFVAAMLGFAGWDTPLGERVGLAVCLFAVAFAVVGQEFNQYWGSLYAPLFCFGVVRCPASLADLWRAASAYRRQPAPA